MRRRGGHKKQDNVNCVKAKERYLGARCDVTLRRRGRHDKWGNRLACRPRVRWSRHFRK
jgi:hypothetical protein